MTFYNFSAFVAVAVFCPAFSFFAAGSFFVGAALSFASLGGRPFRFGGSVPFSSFCFGAASFVPLAASFVGGAGTVAHLNVEPATIDDIIVFTSKRGEHRHCLLYLLWLSDDIFLSLSRP